MQPNRIFLIKAAHTVIFVFMSICLFYILYCAITRVYDWTLLMALVAIFAEGIALLLNHWECPLTSLARRYGAINGSVTDILLPMWLARHTFKVSTVLLAAELLLLSLGYFTR